MASQARREKYLSAIRDDELPFGVLAHMIRNVDGTLQEMRESSEIDLLADVRDSYLCGIASNLILRWELYELMKDVSKEANLETEQGIMLVETERDNTVSLNQLGWREVVNLRKKYQVGQGGQGFLPPADIEQGAHEVTLLLADAHAEYQTNYEVRKLSAMGDPDALGA